MNDDDFFPTYSVFDVTLFPHTDSQLSVISDIQVNTMWNCIFLIKCVVEFEMSCSYPPACQVLLSGCSLATHAVYLIYEYHRTLILFPCVLEQFPYQPERERMEQLYPQSEVMDKEHI